MSNESRKIRSAEIHSSRHLDPDTRCDESLIGTPFCGDRERIPCPLTRVAAEVSFSVDRFPSVTTWVTIRRQRTGARFPSRKPHARSTSMHLHATRRCLHLLSCGPVHGHCPFLTTNPIDSSRWPSEVDGECRAACASAVVPEVHFPTLAA